MTSSSGWLVEERAVQLAIVHLSRRADLLITRRVTDDIGVDLMVTVSDGHRVSGRIFAAQVKAVESMRAIPVGSDQTDFLIDVPLPPVPRDLPIPLCLLVFDMATDEGYFRWLLEPRVEDTGAATLRRHTANVFTRFDRQTLDTVVDDVNHWYDCRHALEHAAIAA